MNDSPEIIPAILPKTYDELSERLFSAANFARTAHIDASDGVFTREASWPYNGEDRGHFDAVQHEDEGMPAWEKLDFEAHLMVAEPEKAVGEWLVAGAMRLIVHVEALKDFDALRKTVGNMTELALALKLETPLDAVAPFADRIDALHLMTISTIGSQGTAFDESSVEKVRAARAKFPGLPISVDGGVSVSNANKLIAAGARRLIVGSALWESDGPREMFRTLMTIANQEAS